MKYFIKYGCGKDIIDVTDYFMSQKKNNIMYIFPDDVIRGFILSDPCIYTQKTITIFTDCGEFFILESSDYAYIDLNVNMIYRNQMCPNVNRISEQ